MQVSEMIALMRILGIGEVNNDDDAKRISLQFLNLAHSELYRETAEVNSDIYIEESLISVVDQNTIELGKDPFSIIKIYWSGSGIPLKGLSRIMFNKYKKENVYVGNPVIYTSIKKIISFYPLLGGTQYNFDVWSVPKISKIEENTPEDTIPYPIEYHSVLVDGALYYLFQDEGGFKNSSRENEALRRWTKGKIDLISYLYGVNRQLISTFENA